MGRMKRGTGFGTLAWYTSHSVQQLEWKLLLAKIWEKKGENSPHPTTAPYFASLSKSTFDWVSTFKQLFHQCPILHFYPNHILPFSDLGISRHILAKRFCHFRSTVTNKEFAFTSFEVRLLFFLLDIITHNSIFHSISILPNFHFTVSTSTCKQDLNLEQNMAQWVVAYAWTLWLLVKYI